MAVTQADVAGSLRPFKAGTFDFQMQNLAAVSGATSGTVTATGIQRLSHIILPSGFKQTTAPVFSLNQVTLAFTVPAETVASRTFQSSMLVTAVANSGAGGNSVTLTFTGGATAGAEVVTVTGTAISIQVESTVSTATQVKAAFDAKPQAVALASMALVAGHETDTVAAATVLPLQNGVTGGAAGTCLLIGRP